MPSDVIIKVENLGKKYRIKHQADRQRYVALRDVLAEKAFGFFKKLKSENLKFGNDVSISASQRVSISTSEDFWALKDVSFEVKQGEVVGIIGRNGAGKSTLLKILSRITEPTEGRVRIKGRVASLLEVGTGFHPELTGRENIFLNGAILGMSRVEIKNKFDEIVAFAEVEKFLDTPVKRYSSGMYVRLAFAVAAHMEPEILIVDEVLAVGDAEFQKKCLGKMQDVSKGGRTVLFVSHQLGMIRDLCSKAILLNQGRVMEQGPSAPIVERYLARLVGGQQQSIRSRHVESVASAGGEAFSSVFFGEPLELLVSLHSLPKVAIGVNIGIRNNSGHLLCLFSTDPHDGFALPRESKLRLCMRLDPCCFAPGEYQVDVAVTEPAVRIIEEVAAVFQFEVQPRRIGGTWAYTSTFGDFFPPHTWRVL